MDYWQKVIFAIKRRHRISQAEIARRLGTKRSVVNTWVNMGVTPRKETAEKLLRMERGE